MLFFLIYVIVVLMRMEPIFEELIYTGTGIYLFT